MGFLAWVEASALGEWVRMSSEGFPICISLHAIGMAIMVGLALALDLRLLGYFKDIPFPALHRFLGIAWIGFGINFLSGCGLFSAQATTYITDITFMSKITLVILGAITAALLQTAVGRDAAGWGSVVPAKVRGIAILSIVFWLSAITMGRLTAYL